jgi:hypothetical protein
VLRRGGWKYPETVTSATPEVPTGQQQAARQDGRVMEDGVCAMRQGAAGKCPEAPRCYTCFLHEDQACGGDFFSESKFSIDERAK